MNDRIIKERVDDFVKEDKRINKEILNELSLYLYATEFPDSDIYHVAKILNEESLMELVCYANGEPIYLPSKLEFRNNYLVGICFYMKEVLKMSWDDIKKVLNLPEKDKDLISSISIGKKINKLKEKFSKDVQRLLKKINVSCIDELIKEKEDINERIGNNK